MFMASDSVTNLHTCLDMYAEQIKEIEGMEMRLDYVNKELKILVQLHCSGCKISIFLSGDYEFLCRMYGLSGASGM